MYKLNIQTDKPWYKYYLTHLCQMKFPILINWTNPFRILGLLGSKFQFHSDLKDYSVSEQWRTLSDAAERGV